MFMLLNSQLVAQTRQSFRDRGSYWEGNARVDDLLFTR